MTRLSYFKNISKSYYRTIIVLGVCALIAATLAAWRSLSPTPPRPADSVVANPRIEGKPDRKNFEAQRAPKVAIAGVRAYRADLLETGIEIGQNGALNDAALASLQKIEGPIEMSVRSVSSENLDRLIGALPNLRSVVLGGTITPEVLSRALSHPNLLHFRVLPKSTIACPNSEICLGAELRSLKFESVAINDATFARLGSSLSLKYLNLSQSAITPATLPGLIRFSNLEVLYFDYISGIDKDAIGALASLRKLRAVKLRRCKLADEHIEQLVKACPLIENLDISESPVTDASVANLGRLRHLKFIDIGETNISPDKLAILHPDCNIVH